MPDHHIVVVNPIGVQVEDVRGDIDEVLSICTECDFMPGAYFPGMPCPECDSITCPECDSIIL